MAATKRKSETAAEAPAAARKVLAFKGFNDKLQCCPDGVPFQFEVGKSYEVEGEIKACQNGFHACEYPLAVFNYYQPASSRFAIVELEGDMDVDGDKTAARKITIVKELTLTEMIREAVGFTVARATVEEGATASGDRGAATASGYQGAATASGYQGAATASGYQGAATASGTRGAATASGIQGAATASGDQGAATASGTRGAATASGFYGKARGKDGSALFLVERLDDFGEDHGKIVHVWAGIVGQDGIKPDTFYTLRDGKPVEVE